MKKKLARRCAQAFEEHFKKKPTHLFAAPGRMNIIGEHVDYNDGFVLPAAINRYIVFACALSDSPDCEIVALDLPDTCRFSLAEPIQPGAQSWANYILGVVQGLQAFGLPARGFQMVFSSHIPMGAGLSSSAALECGVATALNELFSLAVEKQQLASIGQQSEHRFVGVKCGIMDQFASLFGKKKHLILLDCRTLEYEYHAMNSPAYRWLLLDSRVKHSHISSGYNDRRNEVEQGLSLIRKYYPEVQSYRDCRQTMIKELRPVLGDKIYKRCLFVVKEIQRVKKAVKAIDQNDYKALGNLLFETHDGLSKQYEVSCDELDFLVLAASKEKAVLGARMMGGGFGGCALLLVKAKDEKKLVKKLAAQYQKAFQIELQDYPVQIADGAGVYFL